MKIALASARLIDRDMPYNRKQIERYAREAKAAGAGLVCFGETFLQGFNCFDWDFEADRHMAVGTDSEIFRDICALSAELQTDILFGFAELAGEAIYSSAALVGEGRIKHLYRRISKGWKEYRRTDGHYREGDCTLSFVYGGRKFLIGLCGDLWDYPERFRAEEDVLLWPVYISYPPEEWEGGIRQEYAEQAAKCCGKVLMVNCMAEGDAYGGAFFFRDGAVQAQLPVGREGLLIVEV